MIQLDLGLGRKLGDDVRGSFPVGQSSTSSSSLSMDTLQISRDSRCSNSNFDANLAIISDTLEQEILVVFELPDGSIAEGK